MLAGDESSLIETENYDIKLMKRTIKDLVMNDKFNITKFPLHFHDTDLVESTNTTEYNVLGLTVMYN